VTGTVLEESKAKGKIKELVEHVKRSKKSV